MKWFEDKVWFTYKARIRASERLQNNNLHSQFILVWYVLLLTALSIVTIRYPQALGTNTDIILAVLSVGLLVISLLVTNCDFRGRSLMMRDNYLALQLLSNQIKANPNIAEPSQSMLEEYSELLQQCENHLSLDDKYWRVISSEKTSRPVLKKDFVEVATYIVIRNLILILLYAFPLTIVIWPFLIG